MRKLALLLCAFLQQISAHAIVSMPQKEHRVHNIVLYPDKHSWCKTTPIKQVVTHPGCKSIEIENNVCVGACFSYSIPNTEPQTPGDVQPYCDSCQPLQIKWKQLTLECPDSDYGEDNVTVKSVQMISSCACASCKDSSASQTDTAASEPDLDVPELMSLMLETHGHGSRDKEEEMTTETDREGAVTEVVPERVTLKLKRMNEADAMIDLEALQTIRRQIEQQDHKIDDDMSLSSFLEKVKSEENVKVVDTSDNTGVDVNQNHSRHHRVPGPHHSMVYPTYSLDIAADLYQEELKSKSLPSNGTIQPSQEDGSENEIIPIEEKHRLKRKMEKNEEGPR